MADEHAADAPPEAMCAVLEDATLLELILASAAFESAAECARAALVCRLWRHVAARDSVWRAAWSRQAGSLRALEPSVASPRGAGFKTALAQLRAAERLAQCKGHAPWTLADFTLAVDVRWRGRPVLEAAAPADGFVFDADTGGLVPDPIRSRNARLLMVALPASAADAAAQEAARKDCARAGGVDLTCLVRVMRSDGALALLAEHEGCSITYQSEEGLPEVGIYFAERHRRKPPVYALAGQPLHFYDTMNITDEGEINLLHCSVVTCRQFGVSGFKIYVVLSMNMRIWPNYVLHALTHALPWVLPGAGAATTKAAACWLAPRNKDADQEAELEAHG